MLKPCGRIAMPDMVSDETMPAWLKTGPQWSGCISGAFQEQEFMFTTMHHGLRLDAGVIRNRQLRIIKKHLLLRIVSPSTILIPKADPRGRFQSVSGLPSREYT